MLGLSTNTAQHPPSGDEAIAAMASPMPIPTMGVAWNSHGQQQQQMQMQQQMMANIEKVSPESLIQSWFTFDPKIAERFQDMFVTMAGLGGMGKKDK